jgi:F0F1-type ATP synthase delta subunit
MNISAENYAQTFVDLLSDDPNQPDKLVVSFCRVLWENNDFKKAEKIISRIEELLLKKEGRRKIEIYSVKPLAEKILAEFRKYFRPDDKIENKINKNLLAGIKIMINGNRLIDVSLRKKINILFNS